MKLPINNINIPIKESTKKQIKGYGLMGKAGLQKAIGKLTGDPDSEQAVVETYNASQKMFEEAQKSREKEHGFQSIFQKYSSDPKLCEQYYNRINYLDKKLESTHGEKNRRAIIAERLLLKERMINMGVPSELFFKDENYEAALEAYIQRKYISYRLYLNKRAQAKEAEKQDALIADLKEV